MNTDNYVVATIRPWNLETYQNVIKHFPGSWHLITDPNDLTAEKIAKLKPRFIFFPHWSHPVSKEILDLTECVCFHETDLPYGRGGSPIQNLIAKGHRETVITALRMVDELDAGPVYMKRSLSLDGLAEEIFVRASKIIAEMIKAIITEHPEPVSQVGEPTLFKRRKSGQSKIPQGLNTLEELFDHIRMLDAADYPRAYLEYGGFRWEISRPALKTSEIHADIRITKIEETNDD